MLSEPSHHTKRDKTPQKARNLLLHIVQLSTAVVKVDVKVINASLAQTQCLQCVFPPLMHVEIPWPRDATELNNDGMIKLGDVYYQTEPIFSSFQKRFNQRQLLVSVRVVFQQLTFNVKFFLLKSFCLSINGIFYEVRYDITPRNDVAKLG